MSRRWTRGAGSGKVRVYVVCKGTGGLGELGGLD